VLICRFAANETAWFMGLYTPSGQETDQALNNPKRCAPCADAGAVQWFMNSAASA